MMEQESLTISGQIARGAKEKERRPRRLPRPRSVKILLFFFFLQLLCTFTAGAGYLISILGILNAMLNIVEGISVTVWAALAFIIAFCITFLLTWCAGIMYDDWQEHYIKIHEEAHLRAIHNRFWKFPS